VVVPLLLCYLLVVPSRLQKSNVENQMLPRVSFFTSQTESARDIHGQIRSDLFFQVLICIRWAIQLCDMLTTKFVVIYFCQVLICFRWAIRFCEMFTTKFAMTSFYHVLIRSRLAILCLWLLSLLLCYLLLVPSRLQKSNVENQMLPRGSFFTSQTESVRYIHSQIRSDFFLSGPDLH
jgi:hypothetical protein